jgi:hypothetical protein
MRTLYCRDASVPYLTYIFLIWHIDGRKFYSCTFLGKATFLAESGIDNIARVGRAYVLGGSIAGAIVGLGLLAGGIAVTVLTGGLALPLGVGMIVGGAAVTLGSGVVLSMLLPSKNRSARSNSCSQMLPYGDAEIHCKTTSSPHASQMKTLPLAPCASVARNVPPNVSRGPVVR